MKTYKGSCHCGRVKFEVRTDLEKASSCNCSLCRKKGSIHHRVAADRFTLLTGKEALTLYQFGTKSAKHFFCSHCGIYPFHHPRIAPEMISVNLRCLDGFELESAGIEIEKFDGKNWI